MASVKKDNDKEDDPLVYLGKQPVHRRKIFTCQVKKDNEEVELVKTTLQHPCDRLKKTMKKLEFDINTLT